MALLNTKTLSFVWGILDASPENPYSTHKSVIGTKHFTESENKYNDWTFKTAWDVPWMCWVVKKN